MWVYLVLGFAFVGGGLGDTVKGGDQTKVGEGGTEGWAWKKPDWDWNTTSGGAESRVIPVSEATDDITTPGYKMTAVRLPVTEETMKKATVTPLCSRNSPRTGLGCGDQQEENSPPPKASTVPSVENNTISTEGSTGISPNSPTVSSTTASELEVSPTQNNDTDVQQTITSYQEINPQDPANPLTILRKEYNIMKNMDNSSFIQKHIEVQSTNNNYPKIVNITDYSIINETTQENGQDKNYGEMISKVFKTFQNVTDFWQQPITPDMTHEKETNESNRWDNFNFFHNLNLNVNPFAQNKDSEKKGDENNESDNTSEKDIKIKEGQMPVNITEEFHKKFYYNSSNIERIDYNMNTTQDDDGTYEDVQQKIINITENFQQEYLQPILNKTSNFQKEVIAPIWENLQKTILPSSGKKELEVQKQEKPDETEDDIYQVKHSYILDITTHKNSSSSQKPPEETTEVKNTRVADPVQYNDNSTKRDEEETLEERTEISVVSVTSVHEEPAGKEQGFFKKYWKMATDYVSKTFNI